MVIPESRTRISIARSTFSEPLNGIPPSTPADRLARETIFVRNLSKHRLLVNLTPTPPPDPAVILEEFRAEVSLLPDLPPEGEDE
jgi:hypothetical protein